MTEVSTPEVDNAAVLHALAEPHRAALVRLLVDELLAERLTGMAEKASRTSASKPC